ncbi:large conductance mechanosensitive channel protein MscL [Streptomyces sp. NBC_01465]|uniref:large conductance mechanosensitive channel protein MscL n=1 Tax=Streptomyces sp. NBC_01465 TaxID=2903878 RepID=UPI002E36BE06|nr:large conductance mechanosensitive channel protein MscL [Streptomyces sp. NBC_01465]
MTSEEKTSLLEGFKAFLTRGNVVDLAVAVVIGAAFTSVINSVVTNVINPVVGAFGTSNLDGYRACLKGPCVADAAGNVSGVYIGWGAVLSAVISFIATAAVVYFLMVLPMAKYLARKANKEKSTMKEAVQETIEVTELEVLKEIRDSLVAQGGPGRATP